MKFQMKSPNPAPKPNTPPKQGKGTPKVKKLNFQKLDKHNIILIAVSMAAVVGIFVGLIYLERYINKPVEYGKVVISIADIPSGTVLTEENIPNFFTREERDILAIPKGAISNGEDLIGKKLIVDLLPDEMIFAKDMMDAEAFEGSFKDPVELTIGVSSLSDINAGRIRSGDLVNLTIALTNLEDNETVTVEPTTQDPGVYQEDTGIYDENGNSVDDPLNLIPVSDQSIVEEETESEDDASAVFGVNPVVFVMENLYVKNVYGSNGKKIASDDTESSAVLLQLIVERENERIIDDAIVNGSSMRIARVIDTKHIYEEKASYTQLKKETKDVEEDDLSAAPLTLTPVQNDTENTFDRADRERQDALPADQEKTSTDAPKDDETPIEGEVEESTISISITPTDEETKTSLPNEDAVETTTPGVPTPLP